MLNMKVLSFDLERESGGLHGLIGARLERMPRHAGLDQSAACRAWMRMLGRRATQQTRAWTILSRIVNRAPIGTIDPEPKTLV